MALHFFVGYQQYANIELMPKIGEYIDLVMKLVFAFGLCFELPVVLTLLAKVGIVSSQGLREKRRYAIIGVTRGRGGLHAAGCDQHALAGDPDGRASTKSRSGSRSRSRRGAPQQEAAEAQNGTEVTPAS